MKPTALILSAATLLSYVAAETAQPPPVVLPLFNITVSVEPDRLGPIPVPGGSQNVITVARGFVTGALNATLKGGVVYPSASDNRTTVNIVGHFWGVTDDNVDFFMTEVGVGGDGRRAFNRFSLNIGGRYKSLSSAYIVGFASPLNTSAIFAQTFMLS